MNTLNHATMSTRRRAEAAQAQRDLVTEIDRIDNSRPHPLPGTFAVSLDAYIDRWVFTVHSGNGQQLCSEPYVPGRDRIEQIAAHLYEAVCEAVAG